MKFYSAKKGFTLIELMVVIAIIGLLSSVVFVSYNKARQQSRDNVRKSDIEQLALMIRLYIESTGNSDIDCNVGMKIDGNNHLNNSEDADCTDGDAILQFIEEQMGSVPADPLGPGDSDHYYYFDENHASCGKKSLLFARELETKSSNLDDVCDSIGEGPGSDGGLNRANSPWLRELPFVR